MLQIVEASLDISQQIYTRLLGRYIISKEMELQSRNINVRSHDKKVDMGKRSWGSEIQ